MTEKLNKVQSERDELKQTNLLYEAKVRKKVLKFYVIYMFYSLLNS